MEFISEEEFQKVVGGDRATLNEVLTRVFNKGVETAIQMTPELTAQLVRTSVGIRKTTEDFLSANPGFSAHKDIVHKVARDIEIANPGMNIGDVLKASVPEVNRQLEQLKLVNR